MGTDATSTVWNFAYGSNLDPEVRERRGLNPTTAIPGVLRGWRLAFDLRGIPLVEPSMASVAPCPGDEVHGVLLELTPAQYRRLERSEGNGRFYVTEEVEVHTYDGRRIRASAFRTAPACVTRERPPSSRYLGLMRRGARSSGLDDAYCRRLEQLPSASVRTVDRWVGSLAMDALMWSNDTRLHDPCHDYLALLHRTEARGGLMSSSAAQAMLLTPLLVLGAGVRLRRTVAAKRQGP